MALALNFAAWIILRQFIQLGDLRIRPRSHSAPSRRSAPGSVHRDRRTPGGIICLGHFP